MILNYFSEPIVQRGVNNNLPFWYSDKIKPIVLNDVTLNPDIHTFDLCFTRMCQVYGDSKKDVQHLDSKVQLSDKESLLYISFGAHIFAWHEGIEKKIDSQQECRVPKIIEMMTKESGFIDLLARTKEQIVTYGPLADEWTGHLIHLNGIGFILDHKGNFSQVNMNDPIQTFLDKYAQVRGGFIGNNKLKGLDYHMDYKRYKTLLNS